MKITFLGATQEVTGSKYLVEQGKTKLLVDCGFFQGTLEERNAEPLPITPEQIDAVVLTHAHIDHSGYIPALIKQGFTGPVYCSEATYELCKILLPDSGSIQERESEGGPLYTEKEAEKALHAFKTVPYEQSLTIGSSITCKFIRSGHILGASFVVLSDGETTLTFSGDLGRPEQLIMKAPPALEKTDYLVLESTYGDRLHSQKDPLDALRTVVKETISKGGMLIVPAFAVGRVQTILYSLHLLKQKNAIPDIPVYLDSPMATAVTDLFCRFSDEHRLTPKVCKDTFDDVTYIRSVQQSKQLERLKHPAVIIAGSGMATGGRVLYHLQDFISDEKNTVLFVGFQAEETLGRTLLEDPQAVPIYGKKYPVRAAVESIDMLSAHADYQEILAWLSSFKQAPKKVFLTHGELHAAQALQQKIKERFGWTVVIPDYKDHFELS